ncbi:branched chain amino acid ABC transporter inner membrane protein [Halogeometricum pallidum JCM 14848]|uniref:Branched chain amino acid ABC transporter inner membrane protein n=1 Tax=Halogeometricum pallidum JCM 14848 TaxID=1227487 RepID=M0CVY8_HALPD|nr:branched-chain amino acid ABC transporter permease [Halogeometricum pallidum]ELZ27380.1 branched chain amino acid ABC transporter inner membrane protein [Halogeometricum pallidum JCM 14848]
MVAVSTLLGVAVDGLAFGVFLALLGVGITLVFGLGEVLNLAIGTFAVMAVLVATVVVESGMGLIVAAAVALAAVAAFGLVVDRTILSLVYRSEGEERILLGIFTTLGLTVFLDGVLINYFPSRYTLPLNVGTVSVGGATLTGGSLIIIAVGVVVLAILFGFLRGTFLGKATRTVFQDERGARLVGVNPRRIRTLIFVLSAAVAGLGGLVFAAGSAVAVSNGFQFTTFALIISIVGGVRSLVGAVTAGVLLGLVNQFANFFVGSYIATIILFVTAIVVLLARPEAIS